MNFIKNYPQYYLPIIIAPFIVYRYKYNKVLNKNNENYHKFDFKNTHPNCKWCGKKTAISGKCDECFLRMFSDGR